jgi:threonyl-tRNA synthetase
MTDITVALPEGEAITVAAGTTVQDALTALLSNKQRKLTVAATVGEVVADFTTTLHEDTVLLL